MSKHNPHGICQFPVPPQFEQGNSLCVTNFVYEPKRMPMDSFETEDTFIFFLVTHGSCCYHTDYGSYEVSKGDCFFVFPKKRYKIDSIQRVRLLYISFVNPEGQYLLNSLNISYTDPIRSGFEKRIPFFMREFDRSLLLKSPHLIPKSLLLFALSHFEEQRENFAPSQNKSELTETLIQYIEAHYREKISLEELSKQFYFSYNYISQAFRECAGMTFTRYVTMTRFRHAKTLLRTTSHTVNEIALRTGFSDPHYFEKVFKKICNMTPTEYRNSKHD